MLGSAMEDNQSLYMHNKSNDVLMEECWGASWALQQAFEKAVAGEKVSVNKQIFTETMAKLQKNLSEVAVRLCNPKKAEDAPVERSLQPTQPSSEDTKKKG